MGAIVVVIKASLRKSFGNINTNISNRDVARISELYYNNVNSGVDNANALDPSSGSISAITDE